MSFVHGATSSESTRFRRALVFHRPGRDMRRDDAVKSMLHNRKRVAPRDGTCPSSKLNPHEFIGGLDLLAIVCIYGEADKRSCPGPPKRTPNPHRSGAG